MPIKTLVENTSISKDFCNEHGLSLYIETKKHKILFDGAQVSCFFKMTKKLDVNIADVDFLVISHGHYDSWWWTEYIFDRKLESWRCATRLAFEKYYAIRPNNKFDYIGLNENLKENKQIVLTSDRFFITDGIQVFSNIVQRESRPKSNNGLLNSRSIKDKR